MVHNILVQCNFCKKITRIRVQIGYLNSHPIRFHCGECDTLLDGMLQLDQKNVGLKYIVNNAKELIPNSAQEMFEKTSFVVESSGELLTSKIQQPDSDTKSFIGISPFLRATSMMGHENLQKFITRSITLYNAIEKNWPHYRSIFDLWLKNEPEYLLNALSEETLLKGYTCENVGQCSGAVHHLLVKLFGVIYTDQLILKIDSISREVLMLDIESVNRYIQYLEAQNKNLQYYIRKIIDVIDKFAQVFKFLIPAVGLDYCQYEIDLEAYGITTCSVDDIKGYYVDCYEVFLESCIVAISLNNLKFRGAYSELSDTITHIAKDYSKLCSATKGNIIRCLNNELFTGIFGFSPNKDLRNAFGHNSYRFISATQQLQLIGDDGAVQEEKTIYLTTLAHECYKMTQALCMVFEMVYSLQYLNLAQQSDQGFDDPPSYKELINQALLMGIGRNEPCPCGSGLKYKRCHGR